MSWQWLSFAHAGDPEVPGDTDRFLGVVVVEAADFLNAVKITHNLGVNPGGEVVGYPIEEQFLEAIPVEDRNRVLNKSDCDRINEALQKIE